MADAVAEVKVVSMPTYKALVTLVEEKLKVKINEKFYIRQTTDRGDTLSGPYWIDDELVVCCTGKQSIGYALPDLLRNPDIITHPRKVHVDYK